MYFTSGTDRAFEQLMQERPGADHFDSGEAVTPEDCGTCRFYRPRWKCFVSLRNVPTSRATSWHFHSRPAGL